MSIRLVTLAFAVIAPAALALPVSASTLNDETSLSTVAASQTIIHRNGADDPAGDDRGGGKGKGRGGKDDPAGHA